MGGIGSRLEFYLDAVFIATISRPIGKRKIIKIRKSGSNFRLRKPCEFYQLSSPISRNFLNMQNKGMGQGDF